jgi:hypothetical protein
MARIFLGRIITVVDGSANFFGEHEKLKNGGKYK